MDSEGIKNREDLSQFILQLRDDLLANPDEWENPTLELYLEALSAYVKDVQGYYKHAGLDIDPNTPSWRIFADVLIGARIYE